MVVNIYEEIEKKKEKNRKKSVDLGDLPKLPSFLGIPHLLWRQSTSSIAHLCIFNGFVEYSIRIATQRPGEIDKASYEVITGSKGGITWN